MTVHESKLRVQAIDLTKGVLVVCMVIYHGLNYSTQRQLGFLFLAFLPPSFILITGFLISHLYRASTAPERRRRTTRLLNRGIKMLVLFTSLNVLAQLLIKDRARGQIPGFWIFWSHWFDTYISGNGRLAIFEVLLPIAYLLLLAPILLWLERMHWSNLPVVTLLVLSAFAYLERAGFIWFNAQLLSAGLLGMLFGRASIERLDRLREHRRSAVFAYGTCCALAAMFGQSYLLQLLCAVAALILIYSFCLVVRSGSPLSKRLDLLGRYSLVAYIGQIGILQILARWMGRPEPLSAEFLGLIFGALALTVACVELVDWARSRSDGIRGLYNAVFA